MKNDANFKRVVHVDEKAIKPKDKIGNAVMAGNDSIVEAGDTSVPLRPEDFKSIIGRPRVYDLKGNLLAEEENLVVLTGREYIAQKLVGDQGNNPSDLTEYRITHFGVGDSGGATCPATTVGPYDDDVDLVRRVKIETSATIPASAYVDGGNLKQIEYDGEIKIISEEHTINVPTGGQKVVDAYTAIRYTMYIQNDEVVAKPFVFNEAGLFAVEWLFDPTNATWKPTDNYVLFARFTTLDKWLDTGDGIMIEWYVLV